MGFAHGWFRMILRVNGIDSHVLFWDFEVILEKNRKCAKTGKSGHYWAPTPQHREPTSRCRPMLRCGIPSP